VTEPIKEVPTVEMIIPEVPEGYIIFDLRNKPGMLSVGTRNHFSLEKLMGYAPYEIDFYTAIQWLNEEYKYTGDKATLRYCGEWTSEDAKLLAEIDEVQEEFCGDMGMSVEDWNDIQLPLGSDLCEALRREDPFVEPASLFDASEEDLESYRRIERRERRAKNRARDQRRREARETKEMNTDIPVIWDNPSMQTEEDLAMVRGALVKKF